jgi:hypothetical protein
MTAPRKPRCPTCEYAEDGTTLRICPACLTPAPPPSGAMAHHCPGCGTELFCQDDAALRAEVERLNVDADRSAESRNRLIDEYEVRVAAEKARADAAIAERDDWRDGFNKVEAERDALRRIVEEVAASGVTLDDERLDYVEVQISRETWDEAKARAKEGKR